MINWTKHNLSSELLTDDCVEFLAELHLRFAETRQYLLTQRKEMDFRLSRGAVPALLHRTRIERLSDWSVAPAPRDLQKRWVEITGPAEPKMIINALNSGADVFMADFEDSLSPTWDRILTGQKALKEAVRRTLTLQSEGGKTYSLQQDLATLKVRPRGWHLLEENFCVNGEPMSASLFDFGVFFFHNAQELLRRDSGPYFYLPKMESYLEARLWNSVFVFAQEKLEIPRGSVRATVLIETILAAFQMEEILYELREHASGLNAGRWDYLFSLIKKFHHDPHFLLPDRSQVTMRAPFMQAYCQLLVATCHRRGAHAMGGMSAFIPSRHDPEMNKQALEQVAADKAREVELGFDGTWVAHPDLISVARKQFELKLGEQADQKTICTQIDSSLFQELLNLRTPLKITESGFRKNIRVTLQYLSHWLQGQGAVAIEHLMEDAATAEISRSQLWQWIHHPCRLEDGTLITEELYRNWATEEFFKLQDEHATRELVLARSLLDQMVLHPLFVEFLTLKAQPFLKSEDLQHEHTARDFKLDTERNLGSVAPMERHSTQLHSP